MKKGFRLKSILFIVCSSIVLFGSGLIDGYYEATGYSAPGQSKYAAIISAKSDAQRELLEQIYSTKVTSTKSLADNKSLVKSSLTGVLRGAKIVSKKYDSSNGSAQVTMQIGVKKVVETLKKKKVLQEAFYDEIKTVSTPKIKKPVVISYDGLIVDALNTDVEPAIYNRIYSDGKILFDPAELEFDLNIEDGMTLITSNEKTARSFLLSYGVKNPMVIKVIGTEKIRSDLSISINDANQIIKDNKANNYLDKCRVVFLIKKSK